MAYRLNRGMITLRAALLAGVFTLAMAACGSGPPETAGGTEAGAGVETGGTEAAASPAQSAEEDPRVGIFQVVDIDVVRAMSDGFRDAMAEEGFTGGDNIEYIVENAQNETSNATIIASQYVNEDVDLVYALGTPVAQAMYNETADIPLVFGGMTDPIAAGVVDSFENPGGHATGTSDLVPPGEHLDLLAEIIPDLARVGTINNPSEANSQRWQELLEEAAAERDMEVIAAPVANTNEVQPAVDSLAGRVDAIVTTPDNTVEAAMTVVIDAALDNGLPLLVPKQEQAENGALVGMGVDYYELGVINGHQAARILGGEAQPATMPVETMPNPITNINLETAATLGLEIPEAMLERDNVEVIGG